uniref:Uncharacterized protein n=1 Tax=Eutreptiella gymnastica TaxID=73025 RepID=A0A7S4G1F2_9EUGL
MHKDIKCSTEKTCSVVDATARRFLVFTKLKPMASKMGLSRSLRVEIDRNPDHRMRVRKLYSFVLWKKLLMMHVAPGNRNLLIFLPPRPESFQQRAACTLPQLGWGETS